MWRVSDLVECLIFIGLALMLAYTAFVTARFFRRYFLACRESFVSLANSAPAPEQSEKHLIANLSRGLRTLQSIAFAAPFLGLAGACYGILCLFSRGYVGSKATSLAMITLGISTTLVATAAGLVVAIPAGVSYNILRTCLEKFEISRSTTLRAAMPRSYGFAQTLPLQRRFSRLPAFALIGAPVLALLIPMFALMLRSQISVGLPVRLLKIGVSDRDLGSIVISVTSASPSDPATVFVNWKETPWSELHDALRNQLRVRPYAIVYVQAGNEVPWADVTYAIDVARGLQAKVVMLTVIPNIGSSHLPKQNRRSKVSTRKFRERIRWGKKLKGP